MCDVVSIGAQRIFSHEEALKLLPAVRRITDLAVGEFCGIKEHLKWTPREEPVFRRFKTRIEEVVVKWETKITRLGCEASGLWLVSFMAQNGWYSWRYGEGRLNFFSSYEPWLHEQGEYIRGNFH